MEKRNHLQLCAIIYPLLFTRDRLIHHPESFQAKKFIPLIRRLTASPAVSATVARSGPNSTEPPPTFKQFVQFLLATPVMGYDPHWFPYWLTCSPCSVPYDAVLKIETLKVRIHTYILV